LNTGKIAGCFGGAGKCCSDKLKLKTSLNTGVKINLKNLMIIIGKS